MRGWACAIRNRAQKQEHDVVFPFTSIVRYELVRRLRTLRPFLMLLAAVGIASAFIISGWPRDAQYFFNMGRMSSLVILVSCLVTWCAAAILVLPVYGGVSVILERQQETFDQVFLTLITPSGIVLGKLLNTLGMFLLIVLSMLPLVATSYFLIGLDVSSFLVSVLILLSVAYSIASISILCSVLSQSVLRAMIRAFFCAAAAIGGAFFVALYLVVISVEILEIVPRTYVPQNPERFIFIFAPFAAAVGHAVEPEMIPPSTWAWSIVVQLGIGTVCLVAAVYAVRRLALLPLHKAPQSFWRRLLGKRAPRGKPAGPIADHVTPIYARETLWEGFARVGQRRRTLILALLAGGGLLTLILIGRDEFGTQFLTIVWSGMLLASVGLSAPMATANSVTRECELSNLDMLRLTLLRPHHVVLGKALAGLRGLSPLFIAALVLLPLVVYGEYPDLVRNHSIEICLVSLGSACVFALVGTSLGMLASVLTRRTVVSVPLAYILAACAHFLFYLSVRFVLDLISFFWSLFAGHGQWRTVFGKIDRYIMLFSPLLGFVNNADRAGMRGSLITGYWLTNIAICTAYSLCALWIAVRVFRLRWERTQS